MLTSRSSTAVSWLLLNKPETVKRRDFLDLFDSLDLDQLLLSAKRVNASAPTSTMTVLLSYELERLVAEGANEQAA